MKQKEEHGFKQASASAARNKPNLGGRALPQAKVGISQLLRSLF